MLKRIDNANGSFGTSLARAREGRATTSAHQSPTRAARSLLTNAMRLHARVVTHQENASMSATAFPNVLVPFDAAEAISVKGAASHAGTSARTMRRWCDDHGIGRQITAKGCWRISRVALQMHLDGDREALAAYHNGDRGRFEPVARYFRKVGLAHLLELREFGGVKLAA
jgi:hypothetical protein